MLDNETKKRIDTARDILVGKVPDPKSQVEQITIALIYKFMDDMDKEAVEFGGVATYFTGEFEKYRWTKIFDPKVGGHEMLNLYGEAIVKLNVNPNVPQLFRDIFKNAYLPYRDPETLKLFLKTINEFRYDHSEMLGDAFEYLLSVLGSQGDAGQFRTPRHIIDFMVKVLNPQKGESACDPACGTAGFLISSYKQIVEQNTLKSKGDLLTPDDLKRIMQNFVGYDISPDMVRLSLVNLYLHGFTAPRIYEYDTLTSEERWNEYYDIILANPPFMTPKGGIKPHKRFTVQATKSEVLFVDYIAEHINPSTGRAAIIVPNGIVATTQTAYVQLRKLLVTESLVAVISLPAGVFQPYSGVKTSILILDKRLAKKTDHVLFLKIENDGFGLGAQRREIESNDLPLALETFESYKNKIENSLSVGELPELATLVEKETVLKNKDIVFSGERYIKGKVSQTDYKIVKIGEIFKTSSGGTPLRNKSQFFENGTIPWLKSGEVAQGFIYKAEEYITEEGFKNSSAKMFPVNSVLVAMYGATAGQVGLLKFEACTNQAVCAIFPNEQFIPEFLYYILKAKTQAFVDLSGGGGQPNISQQIIKDFEIPLPPLDIQQQIVAEIEGYQKIIDGAKQVVNNYKPTIRIKPEWEMVELGDVCKPEYGYTDSAQEKGDARFIRITDIDQYGKLKKNDCKFIDLNIEASQSLLKKDDLLVARTGATYGKTMIFEEDYPAVFASYLIRLNFDKLKVFPKYYWVFAQSDNYIKQAEKLVSGTGQPQFNGNSIIKIKVPLPTIDEQKEIVKSIEEEMIIVSSNNQLIELFEQKIKDKIGEVWGKE